MIDKSHRFHGLDALNHVYRRNKSVREGVFGMRFCPSKNPDYRLGVVVSKKVHKSAVVRNKIRRRVYEAVRVLKKQDSKNWPFDIVLTVYDESAAGMPAGELRAAVKKLLAKAEIF